VAGLANKAGVPLAEAPVTARHVADVVALLDADAVSGAGAKQALEEAFETGDPIEEIVDRRGLRQVSDTGALGAIVDEVLAEHPDEVATFRGGKESVIGFLVGQVMKRSGGSANPKLAQELLRERLHG
jgi:Asp-tRNA(Asn)/Glu-tRNA(Gln) amidotransferase B subunit